MAKQPERRLHEQIRKALIHEVGGWWIKVWAGPFQKAGIPDVIGCCEGLFFALEAKRGRNQLEAIQEETIARIIEDGKGIAAEVRSVEDALKVVRQGLAEAGRLPAAGSVRRPRAKNTRRSVRSGNWQDLGSGGSDREVMGYVLGVVTPHILNSFDRPTKQQRNNVGEVHRNPFATTKGVLRTRSVREVLRSQGDIAPRRSVRKSKRKKTHQ